MEFCRFQPADRAAFLEMCEDFYSGDATAKPISREQMEHTFDLLIAGSPYAFGYRFDVEGATAGYALGYPFYSNEAGCFCLMLEEIYVKPGFRNRGLGQEYLRRIAGVISADLGVPIGGLRLDVCPENPRARALYESLGFFPLIYTSMVKKVD